MDIRILEFNEVRNLITRGWIPTELRDDIENLYVFGAFEDEEIVGAATFTDSYIKRFTVDFKYIYVHRDYRNRGLATELYASCENSFAEIGIKEIDCECVVATELGEARYNLLKAFGLAPMYLNRKAMRFKRGHFRGDKSDLLYKNMDKVGVKITSIDNYSDRRLLSFMEKKDETEIFLSKEEYDPRMCAFGLLHDNIEAALCMKTLDSKTLITEGYYTSDKIKQKDQLLPFMMAYLVKNNEKPEANFPEIENLYVICKKDYRAEAIESTYGEASEEFYAQKYVKRLSW